ncbi:hypothetical protein FM110_04360 [Brachybacterium nesterenkovii]|uniref:Uncharacterized protein n=1 Tax=Brachybacterium nesterenkovii TaxID=47847 RepID=A0A1X6WWG1_9MICO|nr:hypothetical protein FM110_04360 [Brachybacterium nesterenkovii]
MHLCPRCYRVRVRGADGEGRTGGGGRRHPGGMVDPRRNQALIPTGIDQFMHPFRRGSTSAAPRR